MRNNLNALTRYELSNKQATISMLSGYVTLSGEVHKGNEAVWEGEAKALTEIADSLRGAGKTDAAKEFDDAARKCLWSGQESKKAYMASVNTLSALKKL